MDTVKELRLELLTVAQDGRAGSCEAKATTTILRKHFVWKAVTMGTKNFIVDCLFFLLSRNGL